MSDEKQSAPQRIETVARAVIRNGVRGFYYVYEAQLDGSWSRTGRGYKHSTSCYAQLGRITSRESIAALK